MRTNVDAHRVIIIGAGFGGLQVANDLAGTENIEITLIDRRNHHLFQPLLYQVAGASLSPAQISWPIRSIFRKRPEVRTLLEEVQGIDKTKRIVSLKDGTHQRYDTLIIATGATHAYFGHDEWSEFAPGLKTLDDALQIRQQVLSVFEKAEYTQDAQLKKALQTFVVIGGGPTGVELAGTIAELAHDTLQHDFRNVDPRQSRIVLIEAGQRLLSVFPEQQSAYTKQALEELGVEVIFGQPVTSCTQDGVIYGEHVLSAKTIVWAAGVQASPAAQWLNTDADRAGRVLVNVDMTVKNSPEIFVIGDTASITMPDGKMVPGVAPAAKQQGKYVAKVIKARLKGQHTHQPFEYHHQGNLATIGRSRAVVDMGKFRLQGLLAWWFWKIIHLFFLIGVQSRMSVAMSWLWNHIFGYRSARIISEKYQREGSGTVLKKPHIKANFDIPSER
ncbi:NADH dehydrogenase [Acinetobacter baumannii]|uniref:NAD(P)/FAD-dependent oxidoreductase n=1 Tax=Acinetobacter sp. TR3 TaxID=3003392 RepID=UPI000DE6FCA4|nr:NAD(P)/FAD-dependent oxidoreductase [Acinetobacter sp. TR3]MDO7410118.1 NAD(P)/FAD-dependent oxidoreductase [Acinetobacter baumannii]WAU78198.1 NAD(P)/FAD-dependent oxidoreductase [Acinetobacter sp. TR3]SSS35121.1 NADH dehydrogenase [Acinetobacter baumannii]